MVDWQGVVADIRAHLVAKHADGSNSFGYRELTDLLQELEVRHRLVEGLPEKALRVYGSALQEVLIKNHPPDAATADSAEAEMVGPFTPSSAVRPEKEHHVSSRAAVG